MHIFFFDLKPDLVDGLNIDLGALGVEYIPEAA